MNVLSVLSYTWLLLCVVNSYLNILCCNVETSGGMFTVFYFILFAVLISFIYAFTSPIYS